MMMMGTTMARTMEGQRGSAGRGKEAEMMEALGQRKAN
jgi:hypothetical protein